MQSDGNGNPDVCRVIYTQVAPEAKHKIESFKEDTNNLIHQIDLLMDRQIPEVKRLMAMAKTDYEIACMKLVKALTSDEYVP